MTVTHISKDDLQEQIIAVLSEYGLTFPDFLDSKLEDFTEAELRDLWLMFHDVFVK